MGETVEAMETVAAGETVEVAAGETVEAAGVDSPEATGESSPSERIHLALRDAHRHIDGNVIPAAVGRKCVDGRYAPGTGQLARAGGDMGYVLVLLALNAQKPLGLTPVQCLDLVYGFATKHGGLFSWHTDTLSDPPNGVFQHARNDAEIGCRHCANAADPAFAPDFGLDADQVKTVITYAKARQRHGDSIELVRLAGDHAEQGVLLVESSHYTVNASASEGKSMYFIYDRKRDDDYMFALVYWLQSYRGLGVSLEEFRSMAWRQTHATLRIQAREKPIVHVAIDESGVAAAPVVLQFIP
jgi:hypothetical protein